MPEAGEGWRAELKHPLVLQEATFLCYYTASWRNGPAGNEWGQSHENEVVVVAGGTFESCTFVGASAAGFAYEGTVQKSSGLARGLNCVNCR